MEMSASSSKPMSSKLPISVKTLSGPSIWVEEWKEDDLEDLDPDKSGGELGVGQTVVMVSCSHTDEPVLHCCRRYSKTIGWGKNRRWWAEGGLLEIARKARVSRSWGSKARGDISGFDRQSSPIATSQRREAKCRLSRCLKRTRPGV